MSANNNNENLANELQELFDLKFAKVREARKLADEIMQAQHDIRLITYMFRDEVPDVTIPLGDEDFIKWDSKALKLLYVYGDSTQVLEGVSSVLLARIRPHLRLLVDQAKDFYK